jgi:hypothetical protein
VRQRLADRASCTEHNAGAQHALATLHQIFGLTRLAARA